MEPRASLVGLLVCSLEIAGCSEAKPKAGPPPPTVLVAKVVRRDVALYTEAVGAVDAYLNSEIRARVRGYLEAQGYKDGAQVKAGQLLFAIEPTEYVAAVAQARGALSRADAAVRLADAQLERARALMQTH